MKFLLALTFLSLVGLSYANAGEKSLWRVRIYEELNATPVAQLDYQASVLESGKIFELSSGLLAFGALNRAAANEVHGRLMLTLEKLELVSGTTDVVGTLNLAAIDASGLGPNAASFKSSFSFYQTLKPGQSQRFTFTQGDNTVPGKGAQYTGEVSFVSAEACDDLTDCLK